MMRAHLQRMRGMIAGWGFAGAIGVRLKRMSWFIAGCVFAVAMSWAVPKAWAAMKVIDIPSLAKHSEAINTARQSLQQVVQVKEEIQKTVDAIGEFGTIILPLVDLAKLGSQLRRDAKCLLVDWENMFPSLEFENLDFPSICEASAAYLQALWMDPNALEGKTWQEVETLRVELERDRAIFFQDLTSKALGQGDVAAVSATEMEKATRELEASAKGAQNQNERLAVIAQGQVLLADGIAQQNQILAQMLKIQAATAIEIGTSKEQIVSGEGDGGAGGSGTQGDVP